MGAHQTAEEVLAKATADSNAIKSASETQASEIVEQAHTEADSKKKEALNAAREAAGMTDEEAAKLEADATTEAAQAQDGVSQAVKENAAAGEAEVVDAT